MRIIKPLFSIVLLCTFLSSVLGIQVYEHYCGDFLADVGLFVPPNPCGDEGGEESCSSDKESSCCDDETEFFQLQVDILKQQEKLEKFHSFPVLLAILLPENLQVNSKELNVLLSNQNLPPPKIPIYKKLNRYIYYA